MIRVSVLYANTEGKRFDLDYYTSKHIPMVIAKCGDSLLRGEVDKGLAGMPPGTPAPFIAAGYLYFNSLQEFQAAFAPNAGAIMADIPNYTDIPPTIQISEIVT